MTCSSIFSARSQRIRTPLVPALVVASLLTLALRSDASEALDYNRVIRPILAENCFACHGLDGEAREAELRLDQRDSAIDAGAITVGDPGDSEMIARIFSDDADLVMPPAESKKSLTEDQKATLKRWITEGAEYKMHWAFIPPQPSAPAQVKNASWSNGVIDPRVMAQLESKQLQPNSEADKRTLIRRLTFDLTGLPPTLKEIDDFLQDDSSEAYTALVDRLLSKGQYGEHMARYWADLVRLADTNGMHKDHFRNFSTYRDWLIRAFNENLSFDEFIKYQLAGDLYQDPSQDQLVASGFNRLHLIIDIGTALPEESYHKNVIDRLTAFGTTFLGMTVQCAQCHDHKYDPISQQEFYQLYAFFNNFDGDPETGRKIKAGIQKPFVVLSTAEQKKVLEELKAEEEALVAQIEQRQSREKNSQTKPKLVKASASKSQSTKSERMSALDTRLEKIKKSRSKLLSKIPQAMVMRDKVDPSPTHILIRGAYDAPGEKVQRNTPAFLPPLKKKEGVYSRMDLAKWLVDSQHPLTARVAVNRFWQQFFGVGLVKTSADFGVQGELPSHLELLDDLSIRFIESGWDVKQLVRELVLSQAYRQSSDALPEEFAQDPENRQLARGSRYRLDAEMIRDQILLVSGQLNTTMYGPSVKPPQPPGLWKMVAMGGSIQNYVVDEGDKIYRRSLYTFWKRAMPPPQMTIMNAPSREYCLARRERTNTPLQALLMMNEQEYFKAAKACAELTLSAVDGDVEKGLKLVYEKVTSHLPDRKRIQLMKETLNAFRTLYQDDKALADSLVPELTNSDRDQQIELAAWTMLTHSLFNLDLTKVRR